MLKNAGNNDEEQMCARHIFYLALVVLYEKNTSSKPPNHSDGCKDPSGLVGRMFTEISGFTCWVKSKGFYMVS